MTVARWLGLCVLVSFTACPPPKVECSASSCTGCCDASGVCRQGATRLECGTNGVECAACNATQECVVGVCRTSSNPGGGAAGGSGAGGSAGGSAAGGNVAGGNTAGGSAAGGSTAGGSAAGGSAAGGSAAGGSAAGGSAAGGSAAGGSAAGGSAAGGSAAGGSAAGGGGVPDGGFSGDAGSACFRDDDCRANGQVCDTATGRCIPGRGCASNAECQVMDPADPCSVSGEQCRCDLHDAPTGFAGTCRRRLGVCERCTEDSQCGDDVILFGPPSGNGAGRCLPFMGDPSGAKYCRRQRVGQCACGFIDDGTGYCAPQTNSCAMIGCNTDAQCSSGSACTVSRPDAGIGACAGLCVPRCRWDFVGQQLAAPGCPPGQTCWVDSANLSPTSIFYGAGRCRPPCTSTMDCALSASNPFGGANLVCAPENAGGTFTANRCRASGLCMDDAECPQQPPTVPERGYCDRATRTCNTDCRVGVDPVTGAPWNDCRAPYTCVSDGGVASCQVQPCATMGAAIACNRGEYCCGEDKNGDGLVDPCPPPSERAPNGCYPAPRPPFCTACTSAAQCESAVQPSWLAGSCNNGSRSPSCSPLPMACLPAGARAPGQPSLSVCAPATWNDVTLTPSGRTRAAVGCPVGTIVVPVRPRFTATGDDLCATDADCNRGTSAGRCLPDQSARLPDGGAPKACLCTAGSGASECPNVDGGVRSTCRAGVTGQTTHCVESVVCQAPPALVFADAGVPTFGCGL